MYGLTCCPVWIKELDSVILRSPLQLRMFYDSTKRPLLVWALYVNKSTISTELTVHFLTTSQTTQTRQGQKAKILNTSRESVKKKNIPKPH